MLLNLSTLTENRKYYIILYMFIFLKLCFRLRKLESEVLPVSLADDIKINLISLYIHAFPCRSPLFIFIFIFLSEHTSTSEIR
jgi:hypothetical protein